MGLAGWLINETCCSEESDILLIALRECPGTLDETRSRLIVLYGPVHEWLCRGMRCSVKTSDTLFLTCQLAFKRAIACHCVPLRALYAVNEGPFGKKVQQSDAID